MNIQKLHMLVFMMLWIASIVSVNFFVSNLYLNLLLIAQGIVATVLILQLNQEAHNYYSKLKSEE